MKIRFRPLQHKDLAQRMKWLNDSAVNRYLGSTVRRGTSLQFQEKWYQNYKDSNSKRIFMVLDGDYPIGMVGLTEIDASDKNAHLYIVIGEADYRGRGISQNALKFITEYGFEKLKLHKIVLEVYASNITAIKAYKKFGFVTEGVLRENALIDGGWCDEYVMSLFAPR